MQRLNPEQLTIFDRIKETFVNDEREHEELEKLKEAKDRAAAEARAEMMASMSAAHAKEIAELDKVNTPVEEWPDFFGKEEKIKEQSKSFPTWKFTDKRWDPATDEQKVLGD